MLLALNCQPNGGGFESWRGQNVVFLGKTLKATFPGRGTLLKCMKSVLANERRVFAWLGQAIGPSK